MTNEDLINTLRGANAVRFLHRIIPLGRKYHPLLALLNKRQGLIAVPFAESYVITPALWRKQIANYLLSGADFIPEIKLIQPLFQTLDKGVILDIGANTGLYILLLRLYSSLPIIAYEPDPFLFKLLNQTISYNGIENIATKNLACADAKSELTFAMGINSSVLAENVSGTTPATGPASESSWDEEALVSQSGNAIIKVPTVTLDEDLADLSSIALIKIDCEGYEYHILKGAKKLIERHRPFLFLELHPTMLGNFQHTPEDVIDFLKPCYDLQYWCYQHHWPTTKLGRSIEKFKKSKAYQYKDEDEMLGEINANSGISQVYIMASPKGK